MFRKVIGRARKVGGPKGSWRRRWVTALSVAVVVSTGWVLLQAVHDENFELDRNAITNNTCILGPPCHDWDQVFADVITNLGKTNTSGADAQVFVQDGEGPTIFTGGASKDDLNTTGWQHKTGSTPPKDELLDGFAARYGDILYFGADRIANNGDAVMGFWFFQENVQPQPNGTFGPGQHKNGDILVLSDFTGGGSNVTIRVFQWHSPGGAINGTLDLIAGTLATPADCVGPPSVPNSDPFCATVNTAVTTSPWPFFPKSAPAGSFQKGEFYEGGIDLSFLNLGNACFSSFLAETRSSTSVDAVLKDFVGGAFEACDSSVETTPSDANKAGVSSIVLGGSIYDYAVITGTGSNQSPGGTMDFFICTPTQVAANGGTCSTGGVQVLPDDVSVTAILNTTPPKSDALSGAFQPDTLGTWCWRGEYSGDGTYPAASDASTGECFEVIQLQPSLTTAQTYTLQDRATITIPSAAAGDLAGTLKFELWENSTTCADTATLTTTKPIAGVTGQSASSDTLQITLPGTKTYSWKVSYLSSNTGHKNIGGTCNDESGSLTFSNGGVQPPP